MSREDDKTEMGAAGTAPQAGHAVDAEQPALNKESDTSSHHMPNGSYHDGRGYMLGEEGDRANGFHLAPMTQNKPFTAQNFWSFLQLDR